MAEISVTVDVDASAEALWAAATDWDRHGEWMVATTARGGHGVGATVEAYTGYGPLRFVDTMTVTEWDPPYRCVVRHTGAVVKGTAAFEVQRLDETHSRFVWTEWLVLPFGAVGRAGFAILKPLLLLPLRYSLRRLAALASSR